MQRMKRLTALVLVLMMLPLLALAEGHVINLDANPDAAYAFQEGAALLEVVYANTHGADACILRMGDDVVMIDVGPENQSHLLAATLRTLGIDHVDTVLVTHPHDDHCSGFEKLLETVSVGRLLIGQAEDLNTPMKRLVRTARQAGIPVETAADGRVLTIGGAEMTLIQRIHTYFTTNDLSVLGLVRYGERTLLTTGDAENRAQDDLLKDLPACGMAADIMKYPHHGHAPVQRELYEIISPELVIVTAHEWPAKNGYAFLNAAGTPALSTWYGAIRLRTDGEIWVVDRIETGESNL